MRDIWAGGSEDERVAESNDILVRLLLENQCDFDFIDDDILESDETIMTGGKLGVGAMKYSTICVSRSRWMSDKSVRRLSEFASQGVKVLWLDNTGYSDCPQNCTETGFEQLMEHIRPLVDVSPSNSEIKVCSRQLDNGKLYFIVNEAPGDIYCKISFTETMPMYILDGGAGNAWKTEDTVYSDGKCELPINLPFAGSQLVLFTNERLPVVPEPLKQGGKLFKLEQGWSLRKVKAYRIGEENFETEELNEPYTAVKLGDWRYAVGEDFSGHAEYKIEFKCSREEADKACYLDLGVVKHNCETILNGINLGKRVWNPFALLVKGVLKEGMNELKVIVTNSMANQFATTKSLDKYPEKFVGMYHRVAMAFDRQSLPSGLFGPVTIHEDI